MPKSSLKSYKKMISKRTIIEARNKPWASIHKHSHDLLFMEDGPTKIKIGDNIFEDVDVIVNLNNKPLVWFNEPEEYGAPKRLNALFYD
jgi:hypothetical protein